MKLRGNLRPPCNASGGVLFANRGKKYKKNAAKAKVLESFALKKEDSYRIKTCKRLIPIPAAAAVRLRLRARENQERVLFDRLRLFNKGFDALAAMVGEGISSPGTFGGCTSR